VENDGFGLGAQRRAIEKNDLPQVQTELSAYLQALRNQAPTETLGVTTGLIVSKAKIAANGDYNLSGERYREGDLVNQNWPMVELGNVARLINGRAYKQEELLTEGPVPVLRVGNFFSNRGWYYSDLELEPDKYCNPGDLLFAWSASFGPRIWDGPRAIYHYHIWKVEPTEAIDKMFLFHLLASEAAKIKSEGNGIAMVHATKGGMEKRKFPLPPLEVQKEIVAEIEGYQKVINGARAVLDHYRPHIPIHPDWPMVALGEVIESKPKNGYSGSPVDHATNVKVLSLSATTLGKMDLSKFKYLDETIPSDSPCRCRRGDIYLQRGNTKELVGTAAIFDTDDEDYIYPDLMIRVRADETKIRSHYLLTVLQSGPVREFVTRNAVGAAGNMPKINQTIVESIPIPLPPIGTQQAIVAEIEAEQALVAANRELITRFEQKIQATLARIWGEDGAASPS
jgi:type I restriction enzyme M protein